MSFVMLVRGTIPVMRGSELSVPFPNLGRQEKRLQADSVAQDQGFNQSRPFNGPLESFQVGEPLRCGESGILREG